MSINGKVKIIERMGCSQCDEELYQCCDCKEYFNVGDFVSCGDDDKHICEQCYEDFGPKAINPDKD